MLKYILPFAISFMVAAVSTPLVSKLATRIGAIDIPKDGRRVHNKPIPRIGGLAIFAGFILSILTVLLVFKFDLSIINLSADQLMGILTGALIIVAVGIVDDTKHLNAWIKLFFQILSALIIVYSGIKIEIITNPFSNVGVTNLHHYISIPLTILWIVGVTNAINLIDGLDGLAAGICSIASIALLFVAILNGQTAGVILTAAIAGATLGFLPYNFNPAKIFMGDTGATFLGFMLAVISIEGTLKAYTAVAIAIPVLVLGLPIFDTIFTIARRMLSGKPIMEADRGHLHHRLIDMGLSQRQSVIIMYGISFIFGMGAVFLAGSTTVKVTVSMIVLTVFALAAIRYIVYEDKEDKNVSENKKPAKVFTRKTIVKKRASNE